MLLLQVSIICSILSKLVGASSPLLGDNPQMFLTLDVTTECLSAFNTSLDCPYQVQLLQAQTEWVG
jgi:hypothetical protein